MSKFRVFTQQRITDGDLQLNSMFKDEGGNGTFIKKKNEIKNKIKK